MFKKAKHDGEGEKIMKTIHKKVWIPVVFLIVVAGVGVTSIVAYGKSYDSRVMPGVQIGSVPVGGMTSTELFDYIETMNTRLTQEGVTISYNELEEPIEFILYPAFLPDDNVYELVFVDAQKEVDRVMEYAHAGNPFSTGISALYTRVRKPTLTLENITIDSAQLSDQILERLGEFEQEARDANIVVDDIVSDEEVTFHMVTSSLGVTFDIDGVEQKIREMWSQLEFPDVVIKTIQKAPTVVIEDLDEVTSRLPNMFVDGDLEIAYTDGHTKHDFKWTLEVKDIQDWLEVQKTENEELVLGVNNQKVQLYIQKEIAPSVEVESVNAKFEVGDDGKVSVFRGSRPGVSVAMDTTISEINDAIRQRYWHDEGIVQSVSLTTEVVEPDVKTGDVNDLGITELLGTGYSNFSGSPPNRVKNVRFAVEKKLNGTLIKPGETFSLIDALGPFTVAAGYLPELVIKGDEIKPEVGGGLCQVGSTMFRTAMNSALPIVERRNHSLVVNYYNDHRNGKPGTDATIYDPAPDFKFENNTGKHLLLTTRMNESTGDLFFSLWGTSTGKKGYYTEPVVHNWIPAGPDRITKTTSLAPGAKQCQGAHPGAVTSFTYVIEHEDGTKEEEVFRSHYRSLPRICLVGVTEEELANEGAGDTGEGVGDESSADENGGESENSPIDAEADPESADLGE